ncbi:unnamed protein product [Didymodactylos carnosus]|nr:unnamed protein product [Didymodactylos carnosus]CAF3794959.1 unnamed protein product [Didymodactylos carnosus]
MMSYLLSSSISPNLTSMSDFQSISQQFLFKNYHSPLPQLFDSTKCSDILSTMSSTNLISFAHQNQTIFLILLLLLILIMSCLIILLLLSYCRRKKLNMKRRHLNIELRSDHPIHHLSQTADIRMYNKYYKKINQNQHQDSLYEQLPSSSSDNSEQQFLSSKNTYEKYETPPSCCNYHRQICKPTLPLSCSHHEYQYASYEQDAISSTQPNSTHHHYPHQQQQQCAILLWANRLFYTADHRTHRNCIDYHQSCPSELHHLQACLLNNNNTKKLDSLNRTKTSSVPKYCNDHLSRKQVIQSHIYR